MDERQTLVILPGWGGTKETWQTFIDLARKKYDVVCLNLPCFGDEPCPDTVWGVGEYAAFVGSKIKEYPSKVILLGHSFGGQVAVSVAADHPEHIAKLILSGPAIFRSRRSLSRILFGILAKVGKVIFSLPILERYDLVAKKILYRAAHSPDYQATSGIKREIFKKIIRQDVRPLLQNIHIPTLLLWGTNDVYTPLKYGIKMTSLMPRVKLHIFEGGKHGLHIQMPEAMLAQITTWLQA